MANLENIRVPEDIVPLMESILMRERIPVGVTYNDDFSRTYSFPEGGIPEDKVAKFAEEAVMRFRGLFG